MMTFEAAYRELEYAFELQVNEDNRRFGSEASIYIPNIRPDGPVDYVLVGSEPSLGGWAKGSTLEERMDEARRKLEKGYKNFATSPEDFIFHYCVREYMCQPHYTYHITDLSKGAMLTKLASDKPKDRYERWFDLLKREIGLVAQPGAPIIAIGGEAWRFLSKKSESGLFEGHAVTPILHFGGGWIGNWNYYPEDFPKLYGTFSPTIGLKDILFAAEAVLHKAGMDCFTDETLEKLNRKSGEGWKKLAFTYKISFESIRRGCFHTHWRSYEPLDPR